MMGAAGAHLPLMRLDEEPLSLQRLQAAVDAARDCGFAAVSANDHFVFQTPWLDGPTWLAGMVERSGEMVLATTISLAVLRGPIPLAKALVAIDLLSEGRLVADLGPGSSSGGSDTTAREQLTAQKAPEASSPDALGESPVANSLLRFTRSPRLAARPRARSARLGPRVRRRRARAGA